MEDDCFADGGEVEGDSRALMEHCALECMQAIESKDKQAFLDSFHVLVSDIVGKMESSEGEDK